MSSLYKNVQNEKVKKTLETILCLAAVVCEKPVTRILGNPDIRDVFTQYLTEDDKKRFNKLQVGGIKKLTERELQMIVYDYKCKDDNNPYLRKVKQLNIDMVSWVQDDAQKLFPGVTQLQIKKRFLPTIIAKSASVVNCKIQYKQIKKITVDTNEFLCLNLAIKFPEVEVIELVDDDDIQTEINYFKDNTEVRFRFIMDDIGANFKSGILKMPTTSLHTHTLTISAGRWFETTGTYYHKIFSKLKYLYATGDDDYDKKLQLDLLPKNLRVLEMPKKFTNGGGVVQLDEFPEQIVRISCGEATLQYTKERLYPNLISLNGGKLITRQSGIDLLEQDFKLSFPNLMEISLKKHDDDSDNNSDAGTDAAELEKSVIQAAEAFDDASDDNE